MEVYTRGKAAPPAPIRGADFYHTHREVNRTMRMDTGGLCQYCARKADQRVELYSPLWQAGPIMYGECCLPQAEAALRQTAPKEPVVAVLMRKADTRQTQTFWLTAVITAITGFFSLSAERLLQVKLF